MQLLQFGIKCSGLLFWVVRNQLADVVFVLSMSWPGTSCVKNRCVSHNILNHFDIHGLWPQVDPKCQAKRGDDVDFTKNDLTPEMNKDIDDYWNYLYNNRHRKDPQFWFINHELSKHGDCWHPQTADLDKAPKPIAEIISKANLQDRDSRLKAYLAVVIAWSKTYDLHSILRQNGVSPSQRPVPARAFVAALEKQFGAVDGIFPRCYNDKKNHRKMIEEIRFCLDGYYRVTQCDYKGDGFVKKNIDYCSDEMYYLPFPGAPSEQAEAEL